MSIMLPPALAKIFGAVSGMTWPEANEDELREAWHYYQDFADDIPQLVEYINELVNACLQRFQGDAADAFVSSMRDLIGGTGGADYLAQAQQQAQQLAGIAQDTANQVEYAKWMIIAQLIMLAAEIAIAMAWAPFTFGQSLDVLSADFIITREMLTEIFVWLLKSIAMHTVVGITGGLVMNTIIQGIQFAQHNRTKWDTSSMIQAVEFGAISGVLSGPLDILGGAVGDTLGGLIGKGAGDLLGDALDDALKDAGVDSLDDLSKDSLENLTKDTLDDVADDVITVGGEKSLDDLGEDGLEKVVTESGLSSDLDSAVEDEVEDDATTLAGGRIADGASSVADEVDDFADSAIDAEAEDVASAGIRTASQDAVLDEGDAALKDGVQDAVLKDGVESAAVKDGVEDAAGSDLGRDTDSIASTATESSGASAFSSAADKEVDDASSAIGRETASVSSDATAGAGAGAGAGAAGKWLDPAASKAFSKDVGKLFGKVGSKIDQGFKKTGAGSMAERFEERMGEVFQEHLGAILGREEAKDLGSEFGNAFVSKWVRKGADHTALMDTLHELLDESGLSEDAVGVLAEKLPLLADHLEHEGNLMFKLGHFVVGQLRGGVDNELTQGFYGLIFDSDHKFDLSWSALVGGMAMGMLGTAGHLALGKVTEKWVNYVQESRSYPMGPDDSKYLPLAHPLNLLSIMSNLSGHPAPFPVPRIGTRLDEPVEQVKLGEDWANFFGVHKIFFPDGGKLRIVPTQTDANDRSWVQNLFGRGNQDEPLSSAGIGSHDFPFEDEPSAGGGVRTESTTDLHEPASSDEEPSPTDPPRPVRTQSTDTATSSRTASPDEPVRPTTRSTSTSTSSSTAEDDGTRGPDPDRDPSPKPPTPPTPHTPAPAPRTETRPQPHTEMRPTTPTGDADHRPQPDHDPSRGPDPVPPARTEHPEHSAPSPTGDSPSGHTPPGHTPSGHEHSFVPAPAHAKAEPDDARGTAWQQKQRDLQDEYDAKLDAAAADSRGPDRLPDPNRLDAEVSDRFAQAASDWLRHAPAGASKEFLDAVWGRARAMTAADLSDGADRDTVFADLDATIQLAAVRESAVRIGMQRFDQVVDSWSRPRTLGDTDGAEDIPPARSEEVIARTTSHMTTVFRGRVEKAVTDLFPRREDDGSAKTDGSGVPATALRTLNDLSSDLAQDLELRANFETALDDADRALNELAADGRWRDTVSSADDALLQETGTRGTELSPQSLDVIRASLRSRVQSDFEDAYGSTDSADPLRAPERSAELFDQGSDTRLGALSHDFAVQAARESVVTKVVDRVQDAAGTWAEHGLGDLPEDLISELGLSGHDPGRYLGSVTTRLAKSMDDLLAQHIEGRDADLDADAATSRPTWNDVFDKATSTGAVHDQITLRAGQESARRDADSEAAVAASEFHDGSLGPDSRDRVRQGFADRVGSAYDDLFRSGEDLHDPAKLEQWRASRTELAEDLDVHLAFEEEVMPALHDAAETFDDLAADRGVPHDVVADLKRDYGKDWFEAYREQWGPANLDSGRWQAHESAHEDTFASEEPGRRGDGPDAESEEYDEDSALVPRPSDGQLIGDDRPEPVREPARELQPEQERAPDLPPSPPREPEELEDRLAQVLTPAIDGVEDCVVRLEAVRGLLYSASVVRDDAVQDHDVPELRLAASVGGDWRPVGGDLDGVKQKVRELGDGASALILSSPPDLVDAGGAHLNARHGFVLRNEGGKLVWIETQAPPGQRVREAEDGPSPAAPIGMRAIVLDPRGRAVADPRADQDSGSLGPSRSSAVDALTDPPLGSRAGMLRGPGGSSAFRAPSTSQADFKVDLRTALTPTRPQAHPSFGRDIHQVRVAPAPRRDLPVPQHPLSQRALDPHVALDFLRKLDLTDGNERLLGNGQHAGELSRIGPVTNGVPHLAHSIWFGGALHPDGGSRAEFMKNVAESALAHKPGLWDPDAAFQHIVWTDVPRERFEATRGNIPDDDVELKQVKEFADWARGAGVILANVHEIFHNRAPMHLVDEAFRTELARGNPNGWAGASDLARVAIVYRFGGIYTDGDNRVTGSLSALVRKGPVTDPRFAQQGLVTGWMQNLDSPSNSVLMSRPGAAMTGKYLEVLDSRYRMSFHELAGRSFGMSERDIEQEYDLLDTDAGANAHGNAVGSYHWETVYRTGPNSRLYEELTGAPFNDPEAVKAGMLVFDSQTGNPQTRPGQPPRVITVEFGNSWKGSEPAKPPPSRNGRPLSQQEQDQVDTASRGAQVSLHRELANRQGWVYLPAAARTINRLPEDLREPAWNQTLTRFHADAFQPEVTDAFHADDAQVFGGIHGAPGHVLPRPPAKVSTEGVALTRENIGTLRTLFPDTPIRGLDSPPLWVGGDDERAPFATALEHFPLDERYQVVAVHTNDGLPVKDGQPIPSADMAKQLQGAKRSGAWDGDKTLLFVACGTDRVTVDYVADTMRQLWEDSPDAVGVAADQHVWYVPRFKAGGGPTGAPVPDQGARGHLVVSANVGFSADGRPVFQSGGTWTELTRDADGPGSVGERELGPHLSAEGGAHSAPAHYEPVDDASLIDRELTGAVSFMQQEGQSSGTEHSDGVQNRLTDNYWTTKAQGLPTVKAKSKGKGRRNEEVLKDTIPHLLTRLESVKNQDGQLALWRTMGKAEADTVLQWQRDGMQRKTQEEILKMQDGDLNGIARQYHALVDAGKMQPIPLDGHLGDEAQAKTYFKENRLGTANEQRVLKIVLKRGAHELLFDPDFMALSGDKGMAPALRKIFGKEGRYFEEAASGEGKLGGYLGTKAEQRGDFSIDVESEATQLLFQHFIDHVEDGTAELLDAPEPLWVGDPADLQQMKPVLSRFPDYWRYQPVAAHTERGVITDGRAELGASALAAKILPTLQRRIEKHDAKRVNEQKLLFVTCSTGPAAADYVAEVMQELWKQDKRLDLTGLVSDQMVWFVPQMRRATGADTDDKQVWEPVQGDKGHLVVSNKLGFDEHGLPVFATGGKWLEVKRRSDPSAPVQPRELGPYLPTSHEDASATAPEHFTAVPIQEIVTPRIPGAVAFGDEQGPPRAPWYHSIGANGDLAVTGVHAPHAEVDADGAPKADAATVPKLTEEERDALVDSFTGLPGTPAEQARIRTGIGEALTKVLATGKAKEWQDLLRKGLAFTAGPKTVVLVRFKPGAYDQAPPLEKVDGKPDRYGVDFNTSGATHTESKESKNAGSAAFGTILDLATGAISTLSPATVSLEVGSAVKHGTVENQDSIAGRKLFVKKRTEFLATINASVRVNGRPVDGVATLPTKLRVGIPDSFASPLAAEHDPGTAPGHAMAPSAFSLTEADVVLNAISMDRIIDRVTAELLAPGRLSAKAVAELLPDINEKFLSETSMRNADRRALTSGVGSETFRDTESGSSFRIELKLNGRNAELVEFTPGVTTRDDMGTMQNITASRATAESVRAAVGVGATGLAAPGQKNLGYLTGSAYVGTERELSLAVASNHASHTVLNRTADHARYAVDFTADVQIRFTPGGLLSGGGTLVKFEEQAVGDVSMPRNQAADFELHAFGALKHTAIDAPDEVYVPAHEHGGGVGVRPEIDIPGPVAVRPARLDVDQPTERNDLLPAYLSRGIMGEGFGKLVSLPGSERVLDTIRTGITTMLREARVKPTQAQWRDFENNAAMHYERPALEGDLGAAISGIVQKFKIAGKTFHVSATMHSVSRIAPDEDPEPISMVVNARAVAGSGVKTGYRTAFTSGFLIEGAARIKARLAKIALGEFSGGVGWNRGKSTGFQGSGKKYSRTETKGATYRHRFDVVWQVRIHSGKRNTDLWIDDEGRVAAIVAVPQVHTPRHALSLLTPDDPREAAPPVYAGEAYGKAWISSDWNSRPAVAFGDHPRSVHAAFLHHELIYDAALSAYRKVAGKSDSALDDFWNRPLALRRDLTTTGLSQEFDAIMSRRGWVIPLGTVGGDKAAIIVRAKAYGPTYVNRPDAEVEHYLQGVSHLQQGDEKGVEYSAAAAIGAVAKFGQSDEKSDKPGKTTDDAMEGVHFAASVALSGSHNSSRSHSESVGKIDVTRSTLGGPTHTFEADEVIYEFIAVRWSGSKSWVEREFLTVRNGLQVMVPHRFVQDLGLTLPAKIEAAIKADPEIAKPEEGPMRALPEGRTLPDGSTQVPARIYVDGALGVISGHPERLNADAVFDHTLNVMVGRKLQPAPVTVDGIGAVHRPNLRYRAVAAVVDGLAGHIASLFTTGHYFVIPIPDGFGGTRFMVGRITADVLPATKHMTRPDTELTLRSEGFDEESNTKEQGSGWQLKGTAKSSALPGRAIVSGGVQGAYGRGSSLAVGENSSTKNITRGNPEDASDEFNHPVTYRLELRESSYFIEPFHQILKGMQRYTIKAADAAAEYFSSPGTAELAAYFDAKRDVAWSYDSSLDANAGDLRGSLRMLVPTHLVKDDTSPIEDFDPAAPLVDHVAAQGERPTWVGELPKPTDLENRLAENLRPKAALVSEAIAKWTPVVALPTSRRPQDPDTDGADVVPALDMGTKHGVGVRFATEGAPLRTQTSDLLKGEFEIPLPTKPAAKAILKVESIRPLEAKGVFKDRKYAQSQTKPVSEQENTSGWGVKVSAAGGEKYGIADLDGPTTFEHGGQSATADSFEPSEVDEQNALRKHEMTYVAIDGYVTVKGPKGDGIQVFVRNALHGLIATKGLEDLKDDFEDVFPEDTFYDAVEEQAEGRYVDPDGDVFYDPPEGPSEVAETPTVVDGEDFFNAVDHGWHEESAPPPPPTPPEPTLTVRQIPVAGDGNCLVYSVLANAGPQLRDVFHDEPGYDQATDGWLSNLAGIHSTVSGMHGSGHPGTDVGSARNLVRMVRGRVSAYVDTLDSGHVPLDVVGQLRQHGIGAFRTRVQSMERQELLDTLARLGITDDAWSSVLTPQALRDHYIRARTRELAGGATDPATLRDARATAVADVPWRFTAGAVQHWRDTHPTADPADVDAVSDEALRSVYREHLASLPGGLTRARIDETEWVLGDTALGTGPQTAYVRTAHALPPPEALGLTQLRDLTTAAYTSSTEPLDAQEIQAVRNAVQNWANRWNTPEGDAFLPLTAHALGLRISVLRVGGQAPVAVVGPVGGIPVLVHYNGTGHYTGAMVVEVPAIHAHEPKPQPKPEPKPEPKPKPGPVPLDEHVADVLMGKKV